jgi:hypothetical protein
MEAGPASTGHTRISFISHGMEKPRGASSPSGACEIILRKLREQEDRRVERDRRNHSGDLGQAGQDLPQRPAFLGGTKAGDPSIS